MTNGQIIGLLVSAIIALCGAIVYIFKKGDKKEEEMQQLVKDALNTIHNNGTFIKNADEVLKKVEKLLTNWRGH
jgi:hypothetical protein